MLHHAAGARGRYAIGELRRLDNHLRELNSRHRKLDEVLQEEQRRPSADSLTLTKLKREKLKLKEEIQSLSASTLKH